MSSIPQSTPKTPSGWKSILKRAWPTIRILLSLAPLWKATSGIDWHTLLASEIKMEPAWLIAAALGNMLRIYLWWSTLGFHYAQCWF
jgi:hypothetical protein